MLGGGVEWVGSSFLPLGGASVAFAADETAYRSSGGRAVSRLRTPDGYTTTAHAALSCVREVLGGEAVPGFKTPSLAFGPDFVLEIEGVTREDL